MTTALEPRLPVIAGRGELAGALSAGEWISSRDGRHVVFDRVHAAALLASPDVASPGVDLSRGVSADAVAELLEAVPVMRARKALIDEALGRCLVPSVAEHRRPAARAAFAELLGALGAREHVDFASALAIPYGVAVAAMTVGLSPGSMREVAAIFDPTAARPALPLRVETAVADERLNAMVEVWLADGAAAHGNDPQCALALAARASALPADDLHNALVDVVVATIHGVAASLNAAVVLLASEPAQWRSLQADPELVGAAVEETLRVAVGRPFINRLVLADFEHAGVRFERGDVICVFLAATNAVVAGAAPARSFDVHAPRCPHLSFGRGASFCAGSAVVRVVLVEAVSELLVRLERMEQTAPAVRALYAGREYIDSVPLRLSWA